MYNGDIISFIVYLNRNKTISRQTDEIFNDFEFNKIIIRNLNDEVDFGNGLKITNLEIKSM